MKISETNFNLQSGHDYMVEMAIFNFHGATTPELGNQKFMVHAFYMLSYGALHLCVVS